MRNWKPQGRKPAGQPRFQGSPLFSHSFSDPKRMVTQLAVCFQFPRVRCVHLFVGCSARQFRPLFPQEWRDPTWRSWVVLGKGTMTMSVCGPQNASVEHRLNSSGVFGPCSTQRLWNNPALLVNQVCFQESLRFLPSSLHQPGLPSQTV